MISLDKVWHFLASLGLVWCSFCVIFCTVESGHNRRNPANNDDSTHDRNEDQVELSPTHVNTDNNSHNNNDDSHPRMVWKPTKMNIIILSCFLSFLVGCGKEIADVLWNGWPWCMNGVCHGDGWDVVANLVGKSQCCISGC